MKMETGTIGIVGPGVTHFMPSTIPYEHYLFLTNTFPKAQLRNVSEWYEAIRSIKSAEEIKLVEKAAALNDLCHEEMFTPPAGHKPCRPAPCCGGSRFQT
jgi:Xaa-Pro aminopeptidase